MKKLLIILFCLFYFYSLAQPPSLPVSTNVIKHRINNNIGTTNKVLFFSTHTTNSVELTWNTSPKALGYYVYKGEVTNENSTNLLITKIDVGTNNFVVLSNLIGGKRYYFTVTAYSGTNESLSSNQIYLLDPGILSILYSNNVCYISFVQRTGVSYNLLKSLDLISWNILFNTNSVTNSWVKVMDTNSGMGFYRIITN